MSQREAKTWWAIRSATAPPSHFTFHIEDEVIEGVARQANFTIISVQAVTVSHGHADTHHLVPYVSHKLRSRNVIGEAMERCAGET